MVYINHMVYALDNDHNYHHMYFMGEVEPIDSKSFEAVEEMFEAEFNKIIEGLKK